MQKPKASADIESPSSSWFRRHACQSERRDHPILRHSRKSRLSAHVSVKTAVDYREFFLPSHGRNANSAIGIDSGTGYTPAPRQRVQADLSVSRTSILPVPPHPVQVRPVLSQPFPLQRLQVAASSDLVQRLSRQPRPWQSGQIGGPWLRGDLILSSVMRFHLGSLQIS